MYKVMIVDDEDIIVSGLVKVMPLSLIHISEPTRPY